MQNLKKSIGANIVVRNDNIDKYAYSFWILTYMKQPTCESVTFGLLNFFVYQKKHSAFAYSF